ncbi:hypothetical protein FISHEDRAFT_77689 [Fistulina hepatica ATCC 64428]|uniref:Cytochrome P450 n=1 Tax=Fistulina hepatica ATCC 64428 TaxID=1128425 RepID=A0A0D7A1R7_9AGAR|nr:hypothetical protein FISHEDRAFT_77689 [Fistulina hepatica ATCC 64428]
MPHVHPPTKRIGRVMADLSLIRRTLGLTQDVLHRADTEAVQHSVNVWGEEPGIWRPEHFIQGEDSAQNCAHPLAFGYGPGACITREWAPMAAGIIAAAILYTLEEDHSRQYNVVKGPHVGNREGWERWEIKSAFRPHSLRTVPPLGHVFPPTPDRSDCPTLPGTDSRPSATRQATATDSPSSRQVPGAFRYGLPIRT